MKTRLTPHLARLLFLTLTSTHAALAEAPSSPEPGAVKPVPPKQVAQKRVRASDVFQPEKTILFADAFRSPSLERWNFSEDDRYSPPPQN